MFRSAFGLLYLAAGAFFAYTHHYFEHLSGWHGIVSLVLAILLWPLLFLGIDLHVRHIPPVSRSFRR